MFTGDIVQDGDRSVDPEEGARRCSRYYELLDAVDGTEGQEVFQALVDSMQAEEDYEVYESTLRVAFSFPPEHLGVWLFDVMPGLVARNPERAEDWLNQLAYLGRHSPAVAGFRSRLAEADEEHRDMAERWSASCRLAEHLGYW